MAHVDLPCTTDCPNIALISKANKHIGCLKEDIQRISEELRKKEAMLSNYIKTATAQANHISVLNSPTYGNRQHWPMVSPLS